MLDDGLRIRVRQYGYAVSDNSDIVSSDQDVVIAERCRDSQIALRNAQQREIAPAGGAPLLLLAVRAETP